MVWWRWPAERQLHIISISSLIRSRKIIWYESMATDTDTCWCWFWLSYGSKVSIFLSTPTPKCVMVQWRGTAESWLCCYHSITQIQMIHARSTWKWGANRQCRWLWFWLSFYLKEHEYFHQTHTRKCHGWDWMKVFCCYESWSHITTTSFSLDPQKAYENKVWSRYLSLDPKSKSIICCWYGWCCISWDGADH